MQYRIIFNAPKPLNLTIKKFKSFTLRNESICEFKNPFDHEVEIKKRNREYIIDNLLHEG